MKAGREGEGGRSRNQRKTRCTEANWRPEVKVEHVRLSGVNTVEDDRMMGGCRRRQRKEGHLWF